MREEGRDRKELYLKLNRTSSAHCEDAVPCEMTGSLNLYAVATEGGEHDPSPQAKRDREGSIVEENERVSRLNANRDEALTARRRRKRRWLVNAPDHPPSARGKEREEADERACSELVPREAADRGAPHQICSSSPERASSLEV